MHTHTCARLHARTHTHANTHTHIHTKTVPHLCSGTLDQIQALVQLSQLMVWSRTIGDDLDTGQCERDVWSLWGEQLFTRLSCMRVFICVCACVRAYVCIWGYVHVCMSMCVIWNYLSLSRYLSRAMYAQILRVCWGDQCHVTTTGWSQVSLMTVRNVQSHSWLCYMSHRIMYNC